MIVREHINEKFKEESDPVHDLNIGAKRVYYYFYVSQPVINRLIDFSNPDHVDLLKWLQKYYKQFLTEAEVKRGRRLMEKVGLYIKGSGTGIMYGPRISRRNGTDLYIRRGEFPDYETAGIHGDSRWVSDPGVIDTSKKEHYVRINEAFTEDSDPIADMGIGYTQEIKDKLKKFRAYRHNQFFVKSLYISNNKFIIAIIESYYKWHLKARMNGALKNVGLSSYLIFPGKERDYGYDNKTIEYDIKPEYQDLFKSIKNVNEKFTEEGDPIHDLGIGLPVSIKNSIKKLIKRCLDDCTNKKIYVYDSDIRKENLRLISGPSSLRHLRIFNRLNTSNEEKLILDIGLFSNIYRDVNGIEINKIKYIKDLLKESNLDAFLEPNFQMAPEVNKYTNKNSEFSVWDFEFTIKPEYEKYFEICKYNCR